MDIEKLSMEELIRLNRRIVDRIEYLQSLKTRANLDRFQIGDEVAFTSEGRQIKGLVMRVNKKTVSIKTREGYWRIHPRFLTRIPDSKGVIPQDVKDILEP